MRNPFADEITVVGLPTGTVRVECPEPWVDRIADSLSDHRLSDPAVKPFSGAGDNAEAPVMQLWIDGADFDGVRSTLTSILSKRSGVCVEEEGQSLEGWRQWQVQFEDLSP